MFPAVMQSLPLALGLLLSSLPLTMVPLMLLAKGNRSAMAAFLAGWVSGFLVLGIAVIAVVDLEAPGREGPPGWATWVKIVLGAVLFWLAVKQWLGRPRAGMPVAVPAWMDSIATFSPLRALGFGALMASLNPKFAALVVSGALTIATATVVPKAQFGALLVFMGIASLGLFAPWLVSWWFGERAREPLERFTDWMTRHNAVIMAVVLSVLGALLVISGIRSI